jgi:pyruvate/2-oxoglutarate dehydrogenase complex dihydrolipoamide dehydrogenase (E3) component
MIPFFNSQASFIDKNTVLLRDAKGNTQ